MDVNALARLAQSDFAHGTDKRRSPTILRLRADLSAHGLEIEDGLHIRAFIDHERGYRGDGDDGPVPGWSHGVYLAADGGPLSPEAVERDLIAHMRRWRRHVGRHGMIVLEAHCVAPEIASRLFEPFATHGKTHGTGLGLSICRRIIEDHRGRIFARSEPGRGAVFSFCLPHTAAQDTETMQ